MATDQIKVLDHGYVNLVESWGSDARIIEAARMSTNKGFLGWGPKCSFCGAAWTEEGCPVHGEVGCAKEGDEKLLKFLWDNKHATPFEMAGAVFEIELPIFVVREWHRHRTQCLAPETVHNSYSEMSARYTPLPDTNYVPSVDRLLMVSKTNKQAGTIKGAEVLTEEIAEIYRDALREAYRQDERLYSAALEAGVPKELARVHLPVGRYTRMRATSNLRNWLGFLTLRMAPGAQWEIREYANAVHTLLTRLFPRTLALFDDGEGLLKTESAAQVDRLPR